jgi:thiol-disulfide isomerase/thioredoxin
MKNFFLTISLFLFLTSNLNASTLVTKTLDGKDFNLSNTYGKVVIVNFWAYWCTNCAKKMAILDELYRDYHDRGLEIIGVSIDDKKDREKVLKRAVKVSYPNSMLADAKENDFPDNDYIPVNYIFDRKGNLQVKAGSDSQSLVGKEEIRELLLRIL